MFEQRCHNPMGSDRFMLIRALLFEMENFHWKSKAFVATAHRRLEGRAFKSFISIQTHSQRWVVWDSGPRDVVG